MIYILHLLKHPLSFIFADFQILFRFSQSWTVGIYVLSFTSSLESRKAVNVYSASVSVNSFPWLSPFLCQFLEAETLNLLSFS